jgi:aspartate/methionine/tyrosine aminotransferase
MKTLKFDIRPFYTMEMMKLAAELETSERRTVYHLEVGQSSASTPAPVIGEAIRVLREGHLNYCSALGFWELRKEIAKHYKYAYGIDVDPNCVVITPGTSFGLYIALLMNFNKGDKIAIASPSYPCYRNVIISLGYLPVEIATNQEQNYLITPEILEQYIKEDIKGILIASPNNPTGSVYDEKELKALSLYCQKKGVKFLSDEIYHGITFEKKAETILRFDSNSTVINGFSKYFCMTGWRVGWLVAPREQISLYESLLQNVILCTSPLNQAAAIKGFLCYKELDKHVELYKENRDILYDALKSAGIEYISKPQGAFYIYLEINKTSLKSMDLCKKLLYEEGVAVAPGMDFSSDIKTCIRLSFCQSKSVIEIAASKLNSFINKL